LKSSTLKLSPAVFDNLVLADRVSTWDWICEHVVLREGQRLFPYNSIDYPYHRGILERTDDPRIQEVVVVAGTQVGKSVMGRSWFLCRLATQPGNAIFASSTEKLARQTAGDVLWPMLADCSVTRPYVPASEKLRATDQMRTRTATIRVAWSGSATTLGDWPARWGLAGEVDKWSLNQSDEADPLLLFDKRFGAQPEYQWWKEGTPTYQETSRLWRLLIGGSNERLNVPCPLCGGYQELQVGNGKGGGICWDRGADGKHDALIALRTARYRCAKCGKEWGDEYRMPAVRAGVWVPEGCHVDDRSGKLEGEPLRPWPRASFQLSRLYSPRTTWGKLAREFVECAGQPGLLQDFYNSTLGLPWQSQRRRAKWEEVAGRLVGRHELGVCPEGAIFVTAGIDVQLAHFFYVVSAWGLRATGWCVGLGIAQTWDELRRKVLDAQWTHADGGPPLATELTLIDSRYREEEVYEWSSSLSQVGRVVWPYRGAKAGQLQGRPYRKVSPADPDAEGTLAKVKRRDFCAVTGNTNWWQSWADKCLYDRTPGDDSSYTFHVGAAGDEDLWTQLTNEQLDNEANPPLWIALPGRHDLRDCWRYSRTAAEVNLLGAWSRLAPRAIQRAAAGAKRAAEQETPGWMRKPPPRRR
jgi:phage terminase large subunit GpA-like protein